jgi:hypothetical protein
MPSIRLTKTAIDALPILQKDNIYWDSGFPGFGVKVTPKGRKVFVVLYRTGGAASRLRKYTIGLYGRITLAMARGQAQKIFAARVDGRDPAAEKQEAKRRLVDDRVDDLIAGYIADRVSLSPRRADAEEYAVGQAGDDRGRVERRRILALCAHGGGAVAQVPRAGEGGGHRAVGGCDRNLVSCPGPPCQSGFDPA